MSLENLVANFEYVIWTNEGLEWEDWADDFEKEYLDISDEKKFELMNELNNDCLEEVRHTMDVYVGSPIIIIADLGLWDGRHGGYKIIESGYLRDCMYSDLDGVTWYVDGRGDLRMEGCHHDGRNYYLYRKLREDIGSVEVEEFLSKILNRTMTEEDLEKVTERLGDILENVFDFLLPERYAEQLERRINNEREMLRV